MALLDDFQKLFDGYVACYRARDPAGCAAAFSLKAELYSPYGSPAKGRPAIESIHRDWFEEGGDNKQVRVVSAGRSGDLGWCLAHYSEGATGHGTSLNIIERQTSGSWLITHCSLNEAS